MLGIGPTHDEYRRAPVQTIELGAIVAIGDHQAGIGTLQPIRHRIGSEGGEQRLVDRADAPAGQYRDQQLWRARQHAGDTVALAQAVLGEPTGELLAFGSQFAIAQRRDPSSRVLVDQGRHFGAPFAQVAPATSLECIQPAIAMVVEPGDDIVDGKGLEIGMIVGKGRGHGLAPL